MSCNSWCVNRNPKPKASHIPARRRPSRVGLRRPAATPRQSSPWWRRALGAISWSGWLSLAQLLTALGTVAALAFTAQSLRVTQSQIGLTEQGQITDRFGKAVEQLGSDKPDIRVGGIYALERLALDSARDHPTIIEVLTAFIRHNAPAPCPPAAPDARPVGIATDVQAALTVIARRDTTRDHPDNPNRPINLSGTCLRGATLENAHLDSADLTATDLAGAHLYRADLAQALFFNANLAEAYVVDANLHGAEFRDADLTKADLGGANLAFAGLESTSLTEATLDNSNLTDARLADANLTDAVLARANLSRAILVGADLARANLFAADLTGANLTDARMTDADLTDAVGVNHP
jgi:uncharacterized protein YjbI with pentapeptide repeats